MFNTTGLEVALLAERPAIGLSIIEMYIILLAVALVGTALHPHVKEWLWRYAWYRRYYNSWVMPQWRFLDRVMSRLGRWSVLLFWRPK